MSTVLKNLTPHDITFSGISDGQPKMVTIPASGDVCRVKTETHQRHMIDGIIPVQRQEYRRLDDLPNPKEGIIFVVSGLVLHAMKLQGIRRDDVIAPATGPRDNALKDQNGRVLAVTVFQAA